MRSRKPAESDYIFDHIDSVRSILQSQNEKELIVILKFHASPLVLNKDDPKFSIIKELLITSITRHTKIKLKIDSRSLKILDVENVK